MPLTWDKPRRVYTPNMSDEDAAKWKAKLIRPRDDQPRVEIRKTFYHRGLAPFESTYAQVLIVVRGGWASDNETIRVSANGPITMSYADVEEFHVNIAEARAVLALERTKAVAREERETVTEHRD